jgi:acetate kinase
MFESDDGCVNPNVVFQGELSGIGEPSSELKFHDDVQKVKAETLMQGICIVFNAVMESQSAAVDTVGYRVVHPGAKLKAHQRITEEVVREIETASAFAPLHDPEAVEVIREGMARFPDALHFACFDTVFHQTMPQEASTYPVPLAYRDQGVHRYGFHGLSCESIVRQMKVGETGIPRRMVIAHLGSGCSVTALVDGLSIDNTMGLTPTGGVVMGTRPGDLDPGLVLYLLRQQTGDLHAALFAVETLLNHNAGIVSLSGLANDMKLIRAAAAKGNEDAELALKVFTRSVTKAIGSFSWLMGGLDAIVFAGGIGENDAATREEILRNLQSIGISMDSSLNAAKEKGLRRISDTQSKTAVFVISAQEDLMIAVHVEKMVRLDK